MTGKSLIQTTLGNYFWAFDMKMKNARGKKHSFAKSEARCASRKIRHDKNYINEI